MKHLYFLITIFLSINAFSQPAYFQKNFGSSGSSNNGGSVTQAPSGSIFFVGNFFNTISGDHGFELYKMDGGGTIQWRNQIGLGDFHTNRIIYTKQNKLLINGQLDDSTGNTDAFAMLVDTNGNIIFNSSYGYPNTTDMFIGLAETNDNGFIFSGYTTNPSGPGNANYVVRTDSNGIVLWQQTYAFTVNSVSDDILQTPEGDFLFSGDKKTGSSNYNAQVVKIDAVGNIIWQTDLVFQYNSGCKNMIINNDGDYVVIGEAATATSSYFDPFITKLDTAGNILWSHTVPCSNGPDAGYDIIEPSPDNYLITGFSLNTTTANTDLVVMRLDSLGDEVSRRYYGGPNYDQGYTIIQSSFNNGFLAAGFSILSPESKFLLVYDDYLGIPTSINEPQKPGTLIYPCPADKFMKFENQIKPCNAVIYDAMGKVVFRKTFDTFTKIIDTSDFKNGIYFLSFEASNFSNQKFMVQH